MFEEEMKLEEKSSSFVPLLLIVALVAIIVGIVGYVLKESTDNVTPAAASALLAPSLKTGDLAVVKFHTGTIKTVNDEYPSDARYVFLEKAGIVKIGKGPVDVKPISLTKDGEALLARIPGVQKSVEKNGNTLYVVPLGERKLVNVTGVKMNGPSMATVEYTWAWEPTAMGDLFDAASPRFKALDSWQRAMLIDRHGVKFYHGEPTAASATLIKGDDGKWKLSNE